MRLIDADALGNRMYHESFEKDSDLQRWDGGCWIRYKLFEQVLRAAPTIDPIHTTSSNTLGALDCVERRLVSYKLTDLVNEFEEILSHIREREENDSVCGLCEYDGAYVGQSGDWCNECPGFDKADCFKLKDKYKKEWLELMNTLPSVQPEFSNNSKELEKKLENKNGELISRQEAIDALKICDNNEDGINCHKCPLRDERWDGAWQDNETNCYRKLMRDSAKLLELPSVQPDVPDTNVGELISRQDAIDEIDEWIKAFRENGHKESAADACLIQDGIIQLPSAQPETAKRIVGKSRDGMTLWYQCDMCNEPVDMQDNYCRGCGRRLIDSDLISRQAAIDVLDVLCQEHRYKIPGKGETYSQYNEAWQDALDRAEGAIFNLPSAQPERTCVNCGRTINNGGWYADGRTRCPIEEHYALPKDGYCHLWEKRNVTDDDYPERREE